MLIIILDIVSPIGKCILVLRDRRNAIIIIRCVQALFALYVNDRVINGLIAIAAICNVINSATTTNGRCCNACLGEYVAVLVFQKFFVLLDEIWHLPSSFLLLGGTRFNWGK